jgi:hypothetical protein
MFRKMKSWADAGAMPDCSGIVCRSAIGAAFYAYITDGVRLSGSKSIVAPELAAQKTLL